MHKRGVKKSGNRSRKQQTEVLNNVVSLRISDRERRVLNRIQAANSKSLSDIVREAIDFWLARRKRICLEA